MKVAIYARVSTSDQDESLQLPRLRDFAARNGWEIVKEYTDTATGKNCNRPGWQALMSDARRHDFDRILVVKLDRIMRSIRILIDELEQLNAFGVQIVTLDIGLIDLGNPMSRLTMLIMGSIADWEGEIISERTKEALRAKKERGETLGRPAAELPIHQIALLRLADHSWQDCARQTGICVSTIRNHRKEIDQEIDNIRTDMYASEIPSWPGVEMSRLV